MEKEFIPYTEALELKQLGFNERCFTYYYEDTGKMRTGLSIHIHNGWTYSGTKRLETTLAPTFSQAFRWFREKYQLFSWVKVEYEYGGYSCGIYITGVRQSDIANGPYSTYEEAELACLQKLIEIVKTK